jgi:hypothetical protein
MQLRGNLPIHVLFGAIAPVWCARWQQILPGFGAFEAVEKADIITGSQYSGLTTFANLPHAKCFGEDEDLRYDIAFLGAPFDTVGFDSSVATVFKGLTACCSTVFFFSKFPNPRTCSSGVGQPIKVANWNFSNKSPV